ncbi:phage tail tape measure protein [Bacillus sp. Y1]|nr:phage tail tape measure protein [Bacillus sp. Y1]AYA77335.1 phage tail tape measure protein [Bacillus sp. Y1]
MASIGEIKGTLTLSTEEFDKALKRARDGMDQTGKKSRQTAKDIEQIQNAALALGTAVGVAVSASVGVAANFEQKLADIRAISGATAAEMEQLSDLAKQAGMDTAYSASQSAMAIEELLKAGLSVEQVIGGGLTGALSLAAAGGIDLAKAAEVASIALNSFKDDQLSVSDAANVLSGAASASATDVLEMQYGLSQVSAVAAGVGMTFQDTATALAIFANNGLKGSDSGTSLKTMLQNLQPTTKGQIALFKELGLMTADGANAFFDMNGQLKGIDQIAGILQKSMQGMTDQQRSLALETIFGSDAVRAANILYREGEQGLNNMWDALSKVTAAEVAATKMDTLRGAFEEFKGTIETIGIEVGEDLLPLLTDITRKVTDVLRSFDDMDMANGKSALAFAGVASAIGIALTAIVRLGTALSAFAMTPVGAAVIGVSLLGGAIASTMVYQKEMSEVTLENADAMTEQRDALKANIDAYDSLSARSKLSNDELARFVDINSEITKTADPNIIAQLKDEQAKLYEKSGLTNDELDRLVQLNGDILEVVPESSVVLTDQGNVLVDNTGKAKEFNAQQAEMIRLELEAQKAKAEANMEDYLRKERDLQKQINDLKVDKIDFDEQERKQAEKLEGLREEYAIAKENDDWREQDRLQRTIEMEEGKLTSIKKQRAEAAGLIVEKSKEIEKVQEQIGKLDEVKRKMIDLELKQVGINAKRGEELTTLDTGIQKLEEQKRKLQDTTPVAMRNKQEYKDSVAEIDKQISSLQGVKDRIIDITGKAQTMNYELGRDIRKNITTYQTEYLTQVRRAPLPTGPQDQRHGGGLVGSNQLIQRLSQLPNHNEVDTRLLRNEMVLTEAQQANLMRMIDAGFTGNQPQASSPSSLVVNQTNKITVEGNIDSDIYDDIMRRQTQEYEMKLGMAGVKQR